MGLLQVAAGAVSGVLADQWKEYFYCPSMSNDTLVVKGEKRQAGRGQNKGSDNVISNGSIVVVNEGQCMMIVEQGSIVEFSAVAGAFKWDSSTEPSIFEGGLWQGIKDSFETFKKRVGFGGDTGTDQRVYYFNTKDIIGNKYGTANPVPFRVVDTNINLDVDIAVKCFGEYSYKIQDPILFYKNICGNVEREYTRDQLDSQLKSELLTALQPAFAEISGMGIRYSAVPGHADDLARALNKELSETWIQQYGIIIVKFGVSSIKADEKDEERIKQLQMNAALINPGMQAATMTAATAAAMQSAAANESAGPMMAFAGMNMAQNAGMSANIAQLNAQAQQGGQQGFQSNYAAAPGGGFQQAAPAPAPAPAEAPQMKPVSAGWVCPQCGTENAGNFCMNCGTKKPDDGKWACPQCGTENTGNFCGNCGTKKPE